MIISNKRHPGNCHSPEEPEDTGQLNETGDFGWVLEKTKSEVEPTVTWQMGLMRRVAPGGRGSTLPLQLPCEPEMTETGTII